jgi:RNA polymerase sigma-70 factor (ECF subfamily)
VETLIEQDSLSDGQLIDAANAGDISSLATLYFRYRDWVVNLAFHFIADRELALDVLQDTFLYFSKKFPGFQLTCQMKSFLYPVVKNLSLNSRNKARRYQPGEELFAEIEAAQPGNETAEDLRLAISALPEAHREVVILRFLEEMTLAEIADAVEVPIGTVKSRLHNALEMLRANPKIKSLFE